MEKNGVKKLAGVLKVLVTVTFVCNLLALPLVPGVVSIGLEGGLRAFAELTPYENPLELPVRVVIAFFLVCWQALPRVWRESYGAVLTVFLWV